MISNQYTVISTLLAAALCSCRTEPTAALPASAAPPTVERAARRVTIVGDQFHVDGVRLLIKGSFYCYHPVGKNPWDVHPPDDVLRKHLRELKAAGFNTIRWFQPNSHEIGICEEEGVFVFQQLWIEQNNDYSDPEFRRANIERLRVIVRETRGHGNVLGYLVANEPYLHTATTDKVFRDTMDHLLEIRDMIRQEDPGAYISFDSWPCMVSMDYSPWDFVCFNVYTWSPLTTSEHGMGYRPFLEYLKQRHAQDKPLVILEYGASVCPADVNGLGYGGWTEQDQAEGSIRMLRDILAAGAAGAAYTHFADQIWKAGSNAAREENEPEEWFGMLDLDPAGGQAMEGRWRPVYWAHKEFFRAVVVEPAPCSAARGTQAVLVHSPGASRGRFRAAGGTWQPLRNTGGPWWAGSLDTTTLPDGLHRLEIFSEGPLRDPIARETWIVVANERPDPYALDVRLVPSGTDLAPGDPLTAVVTVRRADGTPVSDAMVRWGVQEHRAWEMLPQTATTDADGRARLTVDTGGLLGLVTLSAGVEVADGDYRRRFGDLAVVRVGITPE